MQIILIILFAGKIILLYFSIAINISSNNSDDHVPILQNIFHPDDAFEIG